MPEVEIFLRVAAVVAAFLAAVAATSLFLTRRAEKRTKRRAEAEVGERRYGMRNDARRKLARRKVIRDNLTLFSVAALAVLEAVPLFVK
ncbi:hypothetical protein [Oerskovia paurometabola]|uniref:hypothetical protein n=1 Tax=Oerskovia paurometabola TaxID=162170 RepID=UPI00341EBFE0